MTARSPRFRPCSTGDPVAGFVFIDDWPSLVSSAIQRRCHDDDRFVAQEQGRALRGKARAIRPGASITIVPCIPASAVPSDS